MNDGNTQDCYSDDSAPTLRCPPVDEFADTLPAIPAAYELSYGEDE